MIYVTSRILEEKSASEIAEKNLIEAFQKLMNVTTVMPKTSIKSRFLKKFLITIVSIKYITLSNSDEFLYSRDITTCFLCLIFRKNFILEQHFVPDKRTNFIVQWCFRKVLVNKRSKVVVISKQLEILLNKKYTINASLLVAHSGAKICDVTNKSNSKVRAITYAGSFLPGRGLELIMKAALEFKGLHFHLYGGSQNELEKFYKIKIGKNITVHGDLQHEYLHSKLKSADLLIAPYDEKVSIRGSSITTEAYMSPLKLFEYMAVCRPLLISDHPSIKEVIKHGYNGFLYKRGSYDSFRSALFNILEQDELTLKKVSKNAMQSLQKYYSWDMRAKRIKSAFNVH